jgi:CheY-like chemotaxis protein
VATHDPGAPLPSSDPARDGSKLRVVVIEDSHDIRETLEEILDACGCEVRSAADGTQGRDLILAIRPDLAFIDVGLPGLDGYQVAEQVRSAADLRGIRLIALTGYGGPEGRARAIEAGFDEQLTKPFTLEQIDAVVARISALRAAGAPAS